MRKLIAIKTCHKKIAWAHAQRQTWVRDIVARGYADVKFFLGKPDHEAYEGPELDEVWLHDAPDGYRGIPLKVQAICQWSVEHCYDFTMLCDDDVFVAPERFSYLPLMANYVGRFRTPYGKVYPPHFASGFAYWLSDHATRIVADTKWNGDWMDERFVATALARRRIFGHHDPINYVVSGPHLGGYEILNSKPYANGTVFCEYGPKEMREMYLILGKAARVIEPHPGLIPQPVVSVTDDILAMSPNDDVPVHKLNRSYHYGV